LSIHVYTCQSVYLIYGRLVFFSRMIV
jgi:hypothetical protein